MAEQRTLVPRDDVIEALAPERADHAFNERIRVGRALHRVMRISHKFSQSRIHSIRSRDTRVLAYRFNWGEDRVMYARADGRTRSLPVRWTSIAPEDPFVTVAAGRAPFRLEDLLALIALLRDLRPLQSWEGRLGVK